MKIRYWDCKFGDDADEFSCGTEEDPDYYWVYPCTHPNNPDKYCHKDNKYGNSKDECKWAIEQVPTA
jgi:hypothetical protein